MTRPNHRGRALHTMQYAAAFLFASGLAVGCSRDNADIGLLGGNDPKDDLSLAVEVSSSTARVGDRITVALRADAAERLLGLQGTLAYDPAQLTFVGQKPSNDIGLAMVNDDQAAQGRLTYIAVNSRDGLSGHVAPLVFEVRGADYLAGLHYALSEAVLKGEVVRHTATIAAQPEVAADLAVASDVRRLNVMDWSAALAASAPAKAARAGMSDGMSFAPGQRLTSLKYGDVNLSGTFSTVDVAQAGNAALGRTGFDLIVGTDSATGNNRDFAIAANVRPVGPPIGGADPARVISVLDIQALQATFLNGGTDVAGVVNTPIRQADQAGCSNLVVPAGIYTGNITWNVPRPCFVQLDGVVRIGGNLSTTTHDSSATLTIAPNTLIKGNSSINPSALYIQRAGRIIAIGTQQEPIEFSCTAAVPSPQCWGGVFLAGNAPVNEAGAGQPASPAVLGRQTGGGNQRQGEGGGPVYGGNNDTDSSGVLRYVRIEYAGFEVAPNSELNCLTLAGVGSGTDIDHVQCHKGSDDGFEFFGGTVDVRYLYSSDNQDDAFDFSFGWNGRAQFVIVQQDNVGDKGIEADNTETTATYDNAPRTSPELYNFTFVRKAAAAGDAIHVRRGTSPEMGHFAVLGYSVGLDVDDAQACNRLRRDLQDIFVLSHDAPGADSLVIRRSRFALPTGSVGNTDSDPAPCNGYATPTAERDFIAVPAFQNDTTPAAINTLLISALTSNPDFRPVPGQLAAPAGSTLPPARANHINFDATGAAYIGAVAPAPATLNAVPWYAGWTRQP